jgi:hypothetical protein
MRRWTVLLLLAVAWSGAGCPASTDDVGPGDGDVGRDDTGAEDFSETSGACPAGTDPDNDGITTEDEGGETLDSDGDTVPNYMDVDSDGDTVSDREEAGRIDCAREPRDSDNDTTPDFLDDDSDGNGILDAAEMPGDTDGDTTPDRADLDDDGDTIQDVQEIGSDPAHPVDTDGDTTPDFRDEDSDGDTIADRTEGTTDTDGDTLPDFRDLDSDGDTLPDATEGTGDPDGDGIPNFRDTDSDNDGLPDSEEVNVRHTNPLVADSDGDGYNDVAEVALGTDPNDPGSVPPPDTFYFVLPYNDTTGAKTQDFSFETTLIMADVFFLIDTTGSMGGEISNLLAGLTDTVIPGVRDRIPDVAMGVGRFEDFPVTPYGDALNRVYELEQQMTTDLTRVYEAISLLRVFRGGDLPEADVPALYGAASGAAIPPYSAPFISDPSTPGAGTIGGAGFRTDSQPIFVVITDAPFHNDFAGNDAYDPLRLDPGTPTIDYPRALAALLAIGARVVGVASSDVSAAGRPDLEDIARDTGTIDDAGLPIVFDVLSDGTGLSSGLVEAIADLANTTPQDVDTFLEDDPSDAVDATRFIESVVPQSADPPTGFSSMDATTFYAVIPGTIVTFLVTAFNDFVEHGATTQVFRCLLVVRGNGVARLDEHDVIILVPARGAGGPFG